MRRIMYYFAIFLIIGAFEYGHCQLKCYSCSSKENATCVNPVNRMEMRRCDSQSLQDIKKYAESVDSKFSNVFEVSLHKNNIPLVPMNCLKQVTIVGKEEYVIRGCQFTANQQHLDICKKVEDTAKKERINVMHCSMCEQEGCNLAPHSRQFTFASALVPLGIHLLKLSVVS